MVLKCQVVEKVSQKVNTYICLEVYITENYKKIVYLDSAEVELLKMYTKKQQYKKGEITLANLVTALEGILTTDAMLANLTSLIPVVGGLIVFAFTFRLVRKMIKGASKGKANI